MCSTALRIAFFLLGVLLVCSIASSRASGQTGTPHRLSAASAGRAALSAREARTLADAWVPPDVDVKAPPVASSEPCPLPDVLEWAGKRVQEMVSNLDRFTSSEFVEHQSVSSGGRLAKVQTRKFDYVVSIGRAPNGYLSMHEYRSLSPISPQFPDRIATEGTPILVLVFHPLYARDFEMNCEGLGDWRGRPAWQVRFEQRRDRQNRLSNVVVKNHLYGVRLRGRAWILADSHQVARLETDLADTIPAIKLRLEHMNVEYQPVNFPARHVELWLPSSAELYLDFAERRFYRRHRFTNFTLFSVDVDQQLANGTVLAN
jgi:hypothetical protein